MSRIAFIGLGMMGTPMAARLAEAGHTLIVKDANVDVQDAFVKAHGASVIQDRSELNADFLILMLPNSAIVESVLSGLSSRLGDGTVVIDMSSSSPLETRALAKRLQSRGINLIDAPVSGGQKGAINGTLSIMVGGDEHLYEKALAVLDVMGRSTYVGPIGAGHALKALNNYLSAAGLLATVEALRAGAAFGLDPSVMTKVFNTSSGRNNTTENKVEQFMLNGKFNSAFALQLMAKDIGIATDLAQQMHTPISFGLSCEDIWKSISDRAPGADHTEMYRLV
jgi:3-hydroxyisobutyrate dehydrogenase